MKNKQMKMVILILIGLVLFMTSLALLMYLKQSDLQEKASKEKMVAILISTRDIKKGELLDAKAVKIGKLPSSYITTTPLTASEVIGRYANVDIFANEPIRKEKISILPPQEQAGSVETVEKNTTKSEDAIDTDTIALPLSVFKNIDSSLVAGDTIDIVSVDENSKKKNSTFDVKYIALNIKIASFVSNGKKRKHYLGYDAKKQPLFAKEIVLEAAPKDIKNFLSLYYETLALNQNRVYNTQNSGHLWMVKCAKEQTKESQKIKEKMLADHVRKVIYKPRKVYKPKETVSISYEQ